MRIVFKITRRKPGIDHIPMGKFFALYPIPDNRPVFIRTQTGAVLVANGPVGDYYKTLEFRSIYQVVEAVGEVTFTPVNA